MTAGCATSSAPPPLAVNVPDDCGRLAQPVPYPPVAKNEDLGVRAAKYAAALGQANGRLASVNACDTKVRQSLGSAN